MAIFDRVDLYCSIVFNCCFDKVVGVGCYKIIYQFVINFDFKINK